VIDVLFSSVVVGVAGSNSEFKTTEVYQCGLALLFFFTITSGLYYGCLSFEHAALRSDEASKPIVMQQEV
jgi:hypothetical protein